jgi:hypothetical protein
VLDNWTIDWAATVSLQVLPTIPAPLCGDREEAEEVVEMKVTVPNQVPEEPQMPVEGLIQEEPGADEPEFHELPEVVHDLVTAPAPANIPAGLEDARAIIISGEERGRVDHLGHRVPLGDYGIYDMNYKYRKWSVNDAPRFIEFLKLTGAAVEQRQARRAMERRSLSREIIDDAAIIKNNNVINGQNFSGLLE